MITQTPKTEIVNGKLLVTEFQTKEASFKELANALYLRRRPSIAMISALHGGEPGGKSIYCSDLPTTEIHRLTREAAAREGIKFVDVEWAEACREAIAKHEKNIATFTDNIAYYQQEQVSGAKPSEKCQQRIDSARKIIEETRQKIENLNEQIGE